MSDDQITRTRLVELEKLGLDKTEDVIARTNEALILHELQRMLERQAERDLAIEEMHVLIVMLSDRQGVTNEEVRRLKGVQEVLTKQQSELALKQDAIAALCDVFAQKLEQEAADRIRLAEELGDRD